MVVELDAVAVVQAVYSSDYDLSVVTRLVEELRSLLSMNSSCYGASQQSMNFIS